MEINVIKISISDCANIAINIAVKYELKFIREFIRKNTNNVIFTKIYLSKFNLYGFPSLYSFISISFNIGILYRTFIRLELLLRFIEFILEYSVIYFLLIFESLNNFKHS